MKNFKIPGISFYMILAFSFMISSTTFSQDLDKVWERFRPEIEKIQNDEDGRSFILTHAKEELELTEDMMSFLVDLNRGAYTKQIDFIMTIPVQKWNPNLGLWGAYELVDVQRVVKKNVTTAFNNVSKYINVISKGLKGYSLLYSIIDAYYGDDKAKLKSLYEASELAIAWISSDLPNIGTAMFSAGLINYALEKFINTTLDEYNEYWWNKYSAYLQENYPSFIQNWANPSMQGDMVKFLEGRLSEFWDSADQYEQGAPYMYRHSEYAKNMLGASFAARYYRDYLHQSYLAWAKRNAEIEEANAWRMAENNAKALKELLNELKMMKAAIEAAEQQMNEKTPVSLIVIPDKTVLKTGETATFRAMAVMDDKSYTDVTTMENTAWSTGSGSFTATEQTESGEHIITVTYMGLEAKATVIVEERETVKENPCPGEFQEWNEEKNKCDCIEGYEMIEELGKCVSIDGAIKEVSGEKPETACDEVLMAAKLARLQEIAAESKLKAAQFNNLLAQFKKAIYSSLDPCYDQIIATAYAGAIQMAQQFEDYQDEATSVSSELILEAALCEINDPKYDINSLLNLVSQIGPPVAMVNEGISEIEAELFVNGCDEQELVNRGNAIADKTTDPEVISGITPGDIINPPNPLPGGTMGVVAVVYDGVNAPMRSVNVTVSFPFRTFNYSLGMGSQEISNFENVQLKEGDRMRITVSGTSLNPSITLLPDDFIWIDPQTNQQTSPGNGLCLFTVVIGIAFNDDEDVNRYEMIVAIGTVGFGIPGFPEGYGRELRF